MSDKYVERKEKKDPFSFIAVCADFGASETGNVYTNTVIYTTLSREKFPSFIFRRPERRKAICNENGHTHIYIYRPTVRVVSSSELLNFLHIYPRGVFIKLPSTLRPYHYAVSHWVNVRGSDFWPDRLVRTTVITRSERVSGSNRAHSRDDAR